MTVRLAGMDVRSADLLSRLMSVRNQLNSQRRHYDVIVSQHESVLALRKRDDTALWVHVSVLEQEERDPPLLRDPEDFMRFLHVNAGLQGYFDQAARTLRGVRASRSYTDRPVIDHRV